jgi:hypothetical protein
MFQREIQTRGANLSHAPDHSSYFEFLDRLSLLFRSKPTLIATTLSNVFTMRLIGNKAHGDLGEIAISEFINQFMYDYESLHVGKDLFRAKSAEEDILVTSLVTRAIVPVSLKAYGDGPLQLSTDKRAAMFAHLESLGGSSITDPSSIAQVYSNSAFTDFHKINVLPLIYRESSLECNVMVFDMEKAKTETARIVKVDANSEPSRGRGRKHPIWRFEDSDGQYICEVRYGGPSANALQRGCWTHTRNALPYFRSITGGWISYAHNLVLVELFAKALNATIAGHARALEAIEADLAAIKLREDIP